MPIANCPESLVRRNLCACIVLREDMPTIDYNHCLVSEQSSATSKHLVLALKIIFAAQVSTTSTILKAQASR